MPTQLDTELAPVVTELINEFGKPLTFYVGDQSGYDPVTGITDEDAATSVQIKASPPAPVKLKYGEDSVARDGDCMTYISAEGLTFTPRPGIKVEIDGVKWQAVAVQPIYTGELVACWGFTLRKEG